MRGAFCERDLRVPLVIVALLCVGGWGCVTAGTTIHLCSAKGTPARLSETEVAALSDAIERRLQPFGIVQHPALEFMQKSWDESPEDEFRIVMAYLLLGRDPPLTDTGIQVSILESKRDGTIVVDLSNRAWPLSQPLADSVLEDLTLAVTDALPTERVFIERSAGIDLR